MRRDLFRRLSIGLPLALLGGACSQRHLPPNNDTASVQVAITQAPDDAGCLRIHATAEKTTTNSFPLKPGDQTTFTLERLPTGSVVFTADALSGDCATGDTQTPAYVSNRVPTQLEAGSNPAITLVMQRNAGLRVAVDFPGARPGVRWVSLDNSAPGTPAEVKLDPMASDPSKTVVNLSLHGLWLEEKMGPDGKKYVAVEAPGLGKLGQIGAPALPVLRADVALATDATDVRLESAETPGLQKLPGLVWPQPTPTQDNPRSPPETFQRNEMIYGQSTPFPAADARAGKATTMLGPIRGVTLEMFPVRFSPADGTLLVAPTSRYTFSHGGAIQQMPPVNKEFTDGGDGAFINWSVVATLIKPELVLYLGHFLFVYPPGYREELLPLINQKKARGFIVTEMTTAETGTTCASVRAAINGWYNGTPAWASHYAILVGDVEHIALCTAPTGDPTDDLYASTNGDDLNEEIYLGRLSVDSEADASNQVTKILAYEDSPNLFFNYGTALLAAHKEGAPGKYVGAHEAVRTFAYAVAPMFTTLYGHVGGVSNADVTSEVNGGTGILAYRGHGDVQEWWSWNTLAQSYTNANVSALANPQQLAPVVWSIACLNANLATNDSIAETWMENANSRAVAHYGATVPSYTDPNHKLDLELFKGVFHKGYTIHARAIKYAEAEMVSAWGGLGESNAWMYLLLGDPQMRIRREAVLRLVLEIPVAINRFCTVGPCPELQVTVKTAAGQPVPGAVVGAWKAGLRSDEVQVNRYTDANGVAKLPVSPETTGKLLVTAWDTRGQSVTGEVEVR